MEITLGKVKQILRKALGFESFVAGFVSSIEKGKVPSIGINDTGKIIYNPDFVAQYVFNDEDLFCLIFHEIMHPLFNHFIFERGEIENIAADAVINAAISTIYEDQSRGGEFFTKLYPSSSLTGILRPGSRMYSSRYYEIHRSLYELSSKWGHNRTTGELITDLKALTPLKEVDPILLLGSHSKEGKAEGRSLPKSVLEGIVRDIRVSMGKKAGQGSQLFSLLKEILRTHLSIRWSVLEKLVSKRKIDRFKEILREKRVIVSPIPIYPSKRDLTLLSAGIYPFHYHNRIEYLRERKQKKGLAIYLDVSGSVNENLPKILGILSHLKTMITSVFLFSNKVHEIPFNDLLKGEIHTTYGTDFNCIARSILERDFDKAVIITDGYASMNNKLKEELEKRGLRTLTILFGGGMSCESFELFGDVVFLEDICG